MTENPLGEARPHAPEPAEELPASVRSAPDLSQQAGAAAGGSAPAGGASYRREVTSVEEFQEAAQLSAHGPLVLALYSRSDAGAVQAVSELEGLVDELAGRVLLLAADVEAVPELAQAFQASSSLNVLALLGGRPAPMYNAPVPADQIKDLLAQVVDLARQSQLTETFEPVSAGEEEPQEKPLPPLHQEAQAALEAGDYAAARDAYRRALNEQPADRDATVGLARTGLLERVQGQDLQQARAAAAEAPEDVEAQLLVADLDVSGGHVEDAFNRLIALIGRSAPETKNRVRERLLELFDVVGAEDPRVTAARGRLMRVLF
ncbi:co-chaperone YbbN [Rothia halotolerans]|uniref:co-chaperone YbbN n=1 Tax=Rothia halotolerans TaxID=405770 RepID=UPI00101C520B|nr:tetratricopeptide repeat protein [Rothia halotolerans]